MGEGRGGGGGGGGGGEFCETRIQFSVQITELTLMCIHVFLGFFFFFFFFYCEGVEVEGIKDAMIM